MARLDRNNEALVLVRRMPCLVCRKPGPSDPDHIRTRGGGGSDDLSNLMPLCREHHVERHMKGLRDFVSKYKLPISWDSGAPERTDT